MTQEERKLPHYRPIMKLRFRDTGEYKFREYESIYFELENGKYIEITDRHIYAPEHSLLYDGLELAGEMHCEIKLTDSFQMLIYMSGEKFNGCFYSLSMSKNKIKSVHFNKTRRDIHPELYESHNQYEFMNARSEE